MTDENGDGGTAEGGGSSGVGAVDQGSKPSYVELDSGFSAVKLPLPKPFGNVFEDPYR